MIIHINEIFVSKGDRLEIYEWRPKRAHLSDVNTQKDASLNVIERMMDEKISLALEPVLMVPLGSRAIQVATLPVTVPSLHYTLLYGPLVNFMFYFRKNWIIWC